MTPTDLGGLALVWSVLAAAGPQATMERVEVRLAPVADSCVSGWANYGDKEWLAISGRTRDYAYWDPFSETWVYGARRSSFLKFDTRAADRMSSARLRLYGAISSKGGGDLWATAWSASDTSWEENTLRGTLTIADGGNLAVGDALDSVKLAKDKTERWYEWDVSEWVLQEKAAGRHVVTLVLEGNDLAFFHSRESQDNPPELVLVP